MKKSYLPILAFLLCAFEVDTAVAQGNTCVATSTLISEYNCHTLTDRTLPVSFGNLGLLAGGWDGSNHLKSTEILRDTLRLNPPGHGLFWFAAANLNEYHTLGAGTLINTSIPLIIGGFTGTEYTRACEKLENLSWVITDSMHEARANFKAITLNNGNILVAGGENETIALNSCEIFDVNTNEWHAAAAMHTPRSSYAYQILGNGTILIAGGYDKASGVTLSGAEIYDPSTDTWIQAADMLHARSNFLLMNNMAVGGEQRSSSNPLLADAIAYCEKYDEQNNSWLAMPSLPEPVSNHVGYDNYLPGSTIITGTKQVLYDNHNIPVAYSFCNSVVYHFCFSNNSWEEMIYYNDNTISPRYGHALVTSDHNRILSGGKAPAQVINNTNYLKLGTVSAIDDKAVEEIADIFPNPTYSNTFTLRVKSELKDIRVRDALGKDIFLNILKISDTDYYIEMNNSTSGIYWLSITGTEAVTTKKIIKN